MLKLLRYIYTVYVAVVFIILLCITVPFFLIFSIFGDRALIIYMWLCRFIAWGLGICSGIIYHFHKNKLVDKNTTYVAVANHRSNMDAPVAAIACWGRVRYLAKKELVKVPLMGQIFSIATVIVDRTSAESRRKSVDALKTYLKNGDHIFIFPEGTRNKTPELPFIDFKDGAFTIAIQSQTPILPMLFINTDYVMPNSPILMRPGLIHIYYLDPVPVNGLLEGDVQLLKEKVKNIMLAKYMELKKMHIQAS